MVFVRVEIDERHARERHSLEESRHAIGRTETSCKQMYRKVGGSTRKYTRSMDEKTKAAMQKIEEDDTIING